MKQPTSDHFRKIHIIGVLHYSLIMVSQMNFKKVKISEECVGCGICESVCPVNNLLEDGTEFDPDKAELAIKVTNGEAVVDEEVCLTCGTCTFNCPISAISAEYEPTAS